MLPPKLRYNELLSYLSRKLENFKRSQNQNNPKTISFTQEQKSKKFTQITSTLRPVNRAHPLLKSYECDRLSPKFTLSQKHGKMDKTQNILYWTKKYVNQ